MPFNDISQGTFTPAGVGGGVDDYCSTHLDGTIREIYIGVNAKATVTTTVKIVGENSTRKVIFYITDPSTLGTFYYPADLTQDCTSLLASTYHRVQPTLRKERPRVIATCTSGITELTVKVYAD